MESKWIGSQHFSSRHGEEPLAIVIHIMEGSLSGTDAWFNADASKVSAHYGVGMGGDIHQYVDEKNAAWHAGRTTPEATFRFLKEKPGVNPNRYTIGIEHEGFAETSWSEEMYNASAALIRDICHRWGIPIDRDHIVGHREIYTHKTCPGDKVDLDKLVELAKQEGI